ncbi:uncharacterized protein LOC108909280 [Anoplophora glabripennis]|uniref:uncharacterized protein LOC108909280 n=1 Tax=Anoplophora glabripennis TaxID=217634 RepID=UPI0008755035|nr:uncharacterized protein LOC108909280 [Anoplophora glabripennis]XP_018569105.1 uncharacterized protein LOC108909280 [Anoplophora glabripennis]
MKLILVPLLLAVSSVRSVPRETITDPTTSPPTATEILQIYDYIVEIGFNLIEDRVPEYLVNILYEQTPNVLITTDDILTLYGLKTVDRITTLDFLRQLNISVENVFSLDGLDKFLTELRIDFKEFYNRVIINRLNITGNPLRDVLIALNININNFSMGMAYGDPDPYEEFKKGNYTYEAVVSALEKANRTLDDLFIACRDEFVTKAISIDSNGIIDSLVKYNFNKNRALNLWRILGITMEDVFRVPGFKQLLDDLKSELNKEPCLGVLTAANTITINKKVYNTWSDDEDLVQPFAESISSRSILQIVDKVDTELDNIILLKVTSLELYAADVKYIEQGKSDSDLQNCKFVTLNNESIVVSDVARAVNHASYFNIPKGNITNLILGSPLICENKVYGLAREMSGDEIVLDSFSGVGKLFLNSYLFSIGVTVYLSIYCL